MLYPKNIFANHKKKIILILFLFAVTLGTSLGIYYGLLKPMSLNYQKGISLLDNGSYKEAQKIFYNLGNFRDSTKRNEEISSYLYADQLITEEDFESAIKFLNSISNTTHVQNRFHLIYDIGLQLEKKGNYNLALSIFLRLKDFEDSRHQANQLIKLIDIRNQTSLATGYRHFIYLSDTNTVQATGDNSYGQCNTSTWTNIKKIYANGNYTVGIKNNGKIVTTGDIAPEGEIISDWLDVKELVLFPYPSLNKVTGLKNDGTILSTNANSPTSSWTNIQHITASDTHIVGHKSDGTLVATGANDKGQCNVSNWNHIKQVIAGNGYTLGLKDNGGIDFTGDIAYSDTITNWETIEYLWAGDSFIVALQTDGSLIAAGLNINSSSLSSWKNICQIEVNSVGILGLQLNHSLISLGFNKLSSFNELNNIHLGNYEFGAVKLNDTLVTKDLLTPPTANDFKLRIDPTLNMAPDDVKSSSWGLPAKIITTTDTDGYHQQWIYGNNSIIFLNNRVVSIQQEDSDIK